MIGRTTAVLAAAMMVSAPVQAQSIGPFAQGQAPLDARATIGVTVPLGGRHGDISSRPRAELRLGQSAASLPISDRATLRAVGIRGSDSLTPAPGALAVTLGSDPRWIAGGRVLGADQDETPEDDDGIDTLEGIGIGVGVVAALAAVGLVVLMNIADCDYDEECS
jgi:hypothetical protein